MVNVAPGAESTLGRKGAGAGADRAAVAVEGVGLPEGPADHDGIAKGVAALIAAQDGLGIHGNDEGVALALDAYTLVGESQGHGISLISTKGIVAASLFGCAARRREGFRISH
jgi:hypothetical protein